MSTPIPQNESLRLEALHRLRVLDSEPEQSFDRITSLAAELYHAPIATITLIDANRQWFKACVGISGRETSREISFCSHAILSEAPLLIRDASEHPIFSSYPNVTGDPFIRFYAGVPMITSDGYAIGTLCAIDKVARPVEAIDLRPLQVLAATTAELLEMRSLSKRLISTENARREMELAYEHIVADLHEIVFQADQHGHWTFLNPAWSAVTGRLVEASLGQAFFDFVAPEDQAAACEFWRTLRNGVTGLRQTFRFAGKEGPLWLDMFARVQERQDGTACITGTLHDLTRQKAIEQNLLDTNAELRREIERNAVAKQRLAEERARLQLTLDTAGDAFIATSDAGCITAWNRAATRLFGYEASEVVDREFLSLIVPERLREAYRADLRKYAESGMEHVSGSPIELPALHKSGREVPVEIAIWPMNIAGQLTFQAFVKDISARKQAEKEARRTRELDLLLQRVTTAANKSQSVQEAIVNVLREICSYGNFALGHFQSAPGADRLDDVQSLWSSAEADELAEFRELSSSMDFAEGSLLRQVLDTNAALWCEDLGRHQKSPRHEVARQSGIGCAFGLPVFSEGETLGVLEFFGRVAASRDEALIAASRSIGSELGQALARKRIEAALCAAKQFAEEASLAKSAFVASISHEIRTPLNAILGMAEVLADTGLNGPQQKYLGTLQRAGSDLLALINTVLDLSKIESRQIELEQIEFDLYDLVDRSLEVIRPRLHGTRVELTAEIERSVPRMVAGDPVRVQQILVNLLGNAAKFTEAGFIKLEIETAKDKPGRLCFAVTDTGIGIPPAKLGIIFEDFVQADASTTRKYGGTGLGLSIARKLALKMGGEMEVQSVVGEGSCFRFTLCLPAARTQDNRSSNSHHNQPGKAAALRILVAEDNPDNRALVAAFLSKTEHQITFAGDGAEAVQLFSSAKFDLVLMDMQMPVIDGLQATKQIRDLEQRLGMKRTPLLAFTANALTKDFMASREAGADGHLSKPISKQKLLCAIEEVAQNGSGVEPATERTADFSRSLVAGSRALCAIEEAAAELAPQSALPAAIEIQIPDGLEELCGPYLEQRKLDVTRLKEFLDRNDLAAIQSLAHNLKGTGEAYGFSEISAIGKAMEADALAAESARLAKSIAELDRFLCRVQLIPSGTPA